MSIKETIKRTSIAASVGAFTALLASTSVSADSVRYADWDNESCIRCQQLSKEYFPSVKEQTGGQIDIQPYFNAVLGGGGDMIRLVRDGIADFGGVWSGYFPKQFAAQSVFATIPEGPKECANQLYFFKEVYSKVPEVQKELADSNHEVIMITPLIHLGFASTTPLTELSQIKGQKWRAGNKWLLGYLEAQEATPVSLAWGDVYVSLQTGVIDGVLANYDGVDNMKFYEQAKHILISDSTWMPVPFTYTVRKDYWDGLSDDVKQGWLKASEEFEQHMCKVLDSERERIVTTQREKGVTVTKMSDADLAKWTNPDTATKLQAQWVSEAKAAGLENADKVLAQVLEIHAAAMARE